VRQLADPIMETRALTLALQAHAGQVDKQGRDYFQFHLQPVADLLRPFGSHAYVAGLLHDVVEDTSVTCSQLAQLGFPAPVVEAVRSVTRQDGESYPDLIARSCADPLGRLVKLADNWHNLSSVDALPDEADRARLRLRYESARAALENSLIVPV
jgi:(p)ppGpp synthase/HD superfamily hydrolase